MGKIPCSCGSKKQQTVLGVTQRVPCFWWWQSNGRHAPVGTGLCGQLHPHCFLALGFRGLLPPQVQAIFETKLREFLHLFAIRYTTKRALVALIPSLAATPASGVQFTPGNYLCGGAALPAVYPDSVMQVILSALQQINRDATLADIGQNQFVGSYLGFYNQANSRSSKTPTYFIDEMRGVLGDVREQTRAAGVGANLANAGIVRGPRSSSYQNNHTARAQALIFRSRLDIALMVARTFKSSKLGFDGSKYLKNDPNKLPEDLKSVLIEELGINENWTPRDGVYVDRDTNDEDDDFKSSIVRDVTGGLIVSEAVLKKEEHYALHFTLTHPLDMKVVNGYSGILVAAKTLQEKSNMFQNEELKLLDTHVWLTMDWTDGLEHIRVKHFRIHGNLASLGDDKIYVNVFYPDNVFYKKLRSFYITSPSGSTFCAHNHEMSAIVEEVAIGDIWLELTYRGPEVEPGIKVLDWEPPATGGDFNELILSDPPPRNQI